MRLNGVAFLVVIATLCVVINSTDMKTIERPSSKTHPTSQLVPKTRKNLLRGDLQAANSAEERGAVAMIGNAGWMKTKLNSYLLLKIHPDVVKASLKVKSKDNEGSRYYFKYFFKYYVRYLDEPLDNLPASSVDGIMKARLYDWLGKSKTPPQVFAKLKLTGTWDSAVNKPNYKYFEQYLKMWAGKQARYRDMYQ